jgi:hypothetical protein
MSEELSVDLLEDEFSEESLSQRSLSSQDAREKKVKGKICWIDDREEVIAYCEICKKNINGNIKFHGKKKFCSTCIQKIALFPNLLKDTQTKKIYDNGVTNSKKRTTNEVNIDDRQKKFKLENIDNNNNQNNSLRHKLQGLRTTIAKVYIEEIFIFWFSFCFQFTHTELAKNALRFVVNSLFLCINSYTKIVELHSLLSFHRRVN